MSEPSPTGVVLMDLGGPRDLSEVKGFVARLLADPAVLPLPGALRRIAARGIAAAREATARAHYEAIGGASPIHQETALQVAALQQALGELFVVRHAFRHSAPEIDHVLAELVQERGVAQVIAIPTFPQRSGTTTDTCLGQFRRSCDSLGIEGLAAGSFPEGRGLVEALCHNAREAGAQEADHVLLAAHGLPESHVRRGDPYVGEVERTAAAVGRTLGRPFSLAFQSRLGPARWVSPYIEEEITRLGKAGVRALTVVPLSFGCENLETRYDLDIEAEKLARSAGIERYGRAAAPGHHPSFIGELARAARDLARVASE